jgi:hypothetical protein
MHSESLHDALVNAVKRLRRSRHESVAIATGKFDVMSGLNEVLGRRRGTADRNWAWREGGSVSRVHHKSQLKNLKHKCCSKPSRACIREGEGCMANAQDDN